jgi:hypothetical protein
MFSKKFFRKCSHPAALACNQVLFETLSVYLVFVHFGLTTEGNTGHFVTEQQKRDLFNRSFLGAKKCASSTVFCSYLAL